RVVRNRELPRRTVAAGDNNSARSKLCAATVHKPARWCYLLNRAVHPSWCRTGVKRALWSTRAELSCTQALFGCAARRVRSAYSASDPSSATIGSARYRARRGTSGLGNVNAGVDAARHAFNRNEVHVIASIVSTIGQRIATEAIAMNGR